MRAHARQLRSDAASRRACTPSPLRRPVSPSAQHAPRLAACRTACQTWCTPRYAFYSMARHFLIWYKDIHVYCSQGVLERGALPTYALAACGGRILETRPGAACHSTCRRSVTAAYAVYDWKRRSMTPGVLECAAAAGGELRRCHSCPHSQTCTSCCEICTHSSTAVCPED